MATVEFQLFAVGLLVKALRKASGLSTELFGSGSRWNDGTASKHAAGT